jgi:hypothetical protein
VTERAIFNRKYTDFTPGGTQVWLVNGAGVTTSAASTQNFTAGSNLIQGQVVYVSGTYALPASAASGVAPERYQAIGITAAAASNGSSVAVNLDDIAVVSDVNITADAVLVPGQFYYLSRYSGELTRYSTASGTVTAASGYAALVNLGLALSTTELHVEIQPPVDLFSVTT